MFVSIITNTNYVPYQDNEYNVLCYVYTIYLFLCLYDCRTHSVCPITSNRKISTSVLLCVTIYNTRTSYTVTGQYACTRYICVSRLYNDNMYVITFFFNNIIIPQVSLTHTHIYIVNVYQCYLTYTIYKLNIMH